MSAGFSIATTTVDSPAKADEIARALVERGLAACVQIAPVRSIYRWKGRIEEADEFRLEMKIRSGDYASVEQAIRDLGLPVFLRTDLSSGKHYWKT